MKLHAKVEEGVFTYVKLTGDFFIHPEESVEDLEGAIMGKESGSEDLRNSITDYFDREDVEVYGLSPDSLFDVLSKEDG